jgi:hypothetical protein
MKPSYYALHRIFGRPHKRFGGKEGFNAGPSFPSTHVDDEFRGDAEILQLKCVLVLSRTCK